MMHPSIQALWDRYRIAAGITAADPPPDGHFCDNQRDADHCAALVIAGRKRATASALAAYERSGEPLPQVGELQIVTDWSGCARALVRTRAVTIRRFADVPAAFALLEGEGDGTLDWWCDAHRAFFERTAPEGALPVDDDFPVVCEEFELLLAG